MSKISIQWVKWSKNGPVEPLSNSSVLIKGPYSIIQESHTPLSAKITTFVP
jgi:hypothetical protein